MLVRPYQEADAVQWDEFCAGALSGTFLHTRRFLSYHGDRFVDRSLIIEEDGRWLGVFPAAQHPQDEKCIVSHPGITYGGILHSGQLRGSLMIGALERIRSHYRELGYTELTYKAVPTIYHSSASDDDLYALFRLGAVRVRCDLSCAIDLRNRLPKSERRRRSFRKALTSGVRVEQGDGFATPIWDVLTENLARKHGVAPVHVLSDIQLLARRFPDNIRFVAGLLNETVVAGVVLFISRMTHHAQYIASSCVGNQSCALDVVFEHCIASAGAQGAGWFDFGISNERGGCVLNDGLYGYKCEFGGGGVIHEFFDLTLSGKERNEP